MKLTNGLFSSQTLVQHSNLWISISVGNNIVWYTPDQLIIPALSKTAVTLTYPEQEDCLSDYKWKLVQSNCYKNGGCNNGTIMFTPIFGNCWIPEITKIKPTGAKIN